jgi:hypothetical protein
MESGARVPTPPASPLGGTGAAPPRQRKENTVNAMNQDIGQEPRSCSHCTWRLKSRCSTASALSTLASPPLSDGNWESLRVLSRLFSRPTMGTSTVLSQCQMGPASLKLVKANKHPVCEETQDTKYGCYDAEFVISEVNSNVNIWIEDATSPTGWTLDPGSPYTADPFGDEFNTIGLQTGSRSARKRRAESRTCVGRKTIQRTAPPSWTTSPSSIKIPNPPTQGYLLRQTRLPLVQTLTATAALDPDVHCAERHGVVHHGGGQPFRHESVGERAWPRGQLHDADPSI